MRNMKKFLALVLATLMVFSMAVISTSAADEADYTEAAHHLAALGVLKGDGKDLLLENGVTRWQAALFFVQALTGKTDAKLWNADKSVYFSDVPEYGTAIDYAYGMNLIVGRGDGTYGYHDAITYQDMLVLAVRALGYETPDMVYPQGYINAATKLGLTDNIAVDVSFKDALTRGETSQIIWDMLGTEVAYTDPLSGKLVYPGEEGLLEALLEKEIDRTTLLKESGFADAEIVATIVEFTEADEDDDESVATVKVAFDSEEVVLDAADLGITEDTPKVNYLGKEVTLYVDCAVADFEEKYADDKAKVVFADFNEYTTVENLGDEGNIKVVLKNNDHNNENTYVSLDGVKFKNSKYYVTLKTWQVEENNGTYTVGWDALTAEDGQLWSNIFGSFVYEDGEYVGKNGTSDLSENAKEFNTYGKVEYRVTDTLVNENGEVYDKDVDTVKKVLVEVLYTPYTFGQYNVFTTKDSTTSKDADFAAYTVGFGTTNRLFGSNTVITKNTASVSATNGAAAKSVV
ncbi:MAG: S-layer homology domain-containing protein, partial [Clostridia bacterium]|nr:S-layer homology domain-containing protein [Clostridia bacterium]